MLTREEMLMFFKSKKRIAEEIAMEIEVGFLPFFQEMGRVEPNGKFHPPEGFYFDSYILGFVITSASMLRDYKHKMKNAAGEKKAMLLLDVLESLSIEPQEAKRLRDYHLNNWHALQQKSEYCDGADHALFIFGLSNGMTSQTHPAPIIQQSLLEAKNLVAVGLAYETKGPQIVALANNTIGAHIRANYSS